MINLIKITEENFSEIAQKVKEFVGTTSFIQTHDWIICPLGEKKTYDELTFDYPKYKFNESTSVLVSEKMISIQSRRRCEFCDECDESEYCDVECDEELELATIGDEIEIQNDFINIVAHSFSPEDDDIVVWRLYR